MGNQSSAYGMQVLDSARAIKEKIKWVLSDIHGKRIVLVAFVGSNPLAYLPHPKGITLCCWPRVPGTNPKGLHALKNSGVNTYAIERLHMKLYWSSTRGAVIGSANLSANALEPGQNHELAVYVSAGTIDAPCLLQSYAKRKIGSRLMAELEKKFAAYEAWEKEHGRQRKVRHKRTRRRVHYPNTKRQRNYLQKRGVSTDRPGRLTFRGKRFVFTGKCEYGRRTECLAEVRRRGGRGEISDKVTGFTDVVVIGAKKSAQWLWKTHGTKIAQANDLRKQNGIPLIIQEERWVNSL
jgi:GNAT superfamily N-acetyltransferase